MNNKIRTLALLLAAAGYSAMAQQAKYVEGFQQHQLSGTPAIGTGPFSYQWYRNGVPIAGCNNVFCTLPANLAYGENVEFKRSAVSSSCPEDVAFSNAFYLTFSGLCINGVRWADKNIGPSGPNPDTYSSFFQWNGTQEYIFTGSVNPAWNNNPDVSPTWTNNRCPAGWRLPTQADFQALHDAGSTWVDAIEVWVTPSERGNIVSGRFYGLNHATCTLPNNMSGCIFLPACGYRSSGGGSLSGQNMEGYYWNSTDGGGLAGGCIYFFRDVSVQPFTMHKGSGLSIRCVQDMQ